MSIAINNSMHNTNKVMQWLTGAKDGKTQLRVLYINLVYCVIAYVALNIGV